MTARPSGKAFTTLGILLLPIALHLLAFSLLAQNTRFYDALPGADERREAHEALLAHYRDAGPLPAGFTEAERAHLKDVKGVFRTVYLYTAVLILAVAGLLGLGNAKRILRHGGLLAVLLPLLAALMPFKGLFAGFHGLFFVPGSWVFPAESGLLALYPEAFFRAVAGWMALLGAVLGKACILGSFRKL